MSQTNPSDAWASGRPHCGRRKKQLLAPDSPAMVNQAPPMQLLGHKGWTRILSKHFLKFQAQTPQMFVSACSLVLVLCATLPDCLVAVLFGPCINISCCWQSNFGARQSVICSSGIVVSLADLIESLQNVWDSLQSNMDPRPRRVLDQGLSILGSCCSTNSHEAKTKRSLAGTVVRFGPLTTIECGIQHQHWTSNRSAAQTLPKEWHSYLVQVGTRSPAT